MRPPLNSKMKHLLKKLDAERSGMQVSGLADENLQSLVAHGLVTIETCIAHLTGKGRKWMEKNRNLFTSKKG